MNPTVKNVLNKSSTTLPSRFSIWNYNKKGI